MCHQIVFYTLRLRPEIRCPLSGHFDRKPHPYKPCHGRVMGRFRGFDRVGDLDWSNAVARPAAPGLLGRLVGVGKHRGIDCRCTREPSLGQVRGLALGLDSSWHISMAYSAAAGLAGRLVVVGKLCGLSRRDGHWPAPHGVPGTVLGAVVGAMTGIALAWLLRQPRREA